jgi:hypothetical protein
MDRNVIGSHSVSNDNQNTFNAGQNSVVLFLSSASIPHPTSVGKLEGSIIESETPECEASMMPNVLRYSVKRIMHYCNKPYKFTRINHLKHEFLLYTPFVPLRKRNAPTL